MYCNMKKSGSMMGMAMMGMGMAMMMGMMMGSCATRQMMDKSSKMRKFGMKKNSEDSEMSQALNNVPSSFGNHAHFNWLQ